MAFCSAPSQVFQHWQGCSLRHYEAEPFERRFELIGVDYTHSQDSFVDGQTKSRCPRSRRRSVARWIGLINEPLCEPVAWVLPGNGSSSAHPQRSLDYECN